MKRRHEPEEFDDVDSENIDPSLFASPSKKNKSFDDNTSKSQDVCHFVLKEVHKSSALANPSITAPTTTSQKRKAEDEVPAPPKSPKALRSTALPAAGRSPKAKRIGILSRRRTRVDPPSFSQNSGLNPLPFSIDAALSGSLKSSQPTPVSTLEDIKPKGWMFPIHQDTPDEEAGNLMEHAACTLDISSDEESTAAKNSRGKENIPPTEDLAAFAAPVQATSSVLANRKDMMTDSTREALGELEASHFYAEGCEATSLIIVPAEKTVEISAENNAVTTAFSPELPSAQPSTPTHHGWETLLSQLQDEKKPTSIPTESALELVNAEQAEAFAIWESESAKGSP